MASCKKAREIHENIQYLGDREGSSKNKKMRKHSEGLYTNTSYIESKQKPTSKEVKSKRTQTQTGFI